MIGVVASLPHAQYQLLESLQEAMRKVVKGVGGFDHAQVRREERRGLCWLATALCPLHHPTCCLPRHSTARNSHMPRGLHVWLLPLLLPRWAAHVAADSMYTARVCFLSSTFLLGLVADWPAPVPPTRPFPAPADLPPCRAVARLQQPAHARHPRPPVCGWRPDRAVSGPQVSCCQHYSVINSVINHSLNLCWAVWEAWEDGGLPLPCEPCTCLHQAPQHRLPSCPRRPPNPVSCSRRGSPLWRCCRRDSAEAVIAAMAGGGATVESVTQLVEELSRLH